MEELKLIMEMVGQLSGNAQTVAIVYFCYKGILVLTAQGLVVGFMIALYKILCKVCLNCAMISRVATTWGFTTPLNNEELKTIINCCPTAKNKGE